MYIYIKRILDILFSLLFLIILFIPIIIISILIIIIDRHNPFFTQIRTGKNGKEFKLYKFKTMKNKKITKLGKFLRNSSLDEIPQIINILEGNMSFIGPRPWIVDYYKYMNEKQRKRNNVLPGLTGLAQINGRNGISINEKINYDLEYIEKLSFKEDMYIFLKTIYTVFKKENIDINEEGIKKEIDILRKQ